MSTVKKRFDRGDYTLRELAELTGKSTRQISRYTSKPREEYLASVRKRHDRIMALHDDGKKPKEIAQELDTPIRTVYYVLKERDA